MFAKFGALQLYVFIFYRKSPYCAHIHLRNHDKSFDPVFITSSKSIILHFMFEVSQLDQISKEVIMPQSRYIQRCNSSQFWHKRFSEKSAMFLASAASF